MDKSACSLIISYNKIVNYTYFFGLVEVQVPVSMTNPTDYKAELFVTLRAKARGWTVLNPNPFTLSTVTVKPYP